jgi:AcrR family transcriptional regulator
MPYPAQIDYALVLATAEELVEREGAEQLTLALLATTLGVKTPSLYRYIESRDALIRTLNEQTIERLFGYYQEVLVHGDRSPIEQLQAICSAHRHFAHTYPRSYSLALTTSAMVQRPDPAKLVQLVLPLQAIVAQITGAEQSLTALRGLLAIVHGFVMLELHDQLQRGGDLQAAYEQSVAAYLAGLPAHLKLR